MSQVGSTTCDSAFDNHLRAFKKPGIRRRYWLVNIVTLFQLLRSIATHSFFET